MCMGANVAVLAGRPYVEETSEGTRQPIAETLARRRARRDPDSPLVFHRNGIPIRRWRTAWRTACQAAGVPTRFLHDCRRTAARNLIRASVPERVAMLLTGHKTRAIFDRYNIIHEQELFEAGDQLVASLAQHAQATPRGLNPGFSEKIGNSRRTGRSRSVSTHPSELVRSRPLCHGVFVYRVDVMDVAGRCCMKPLAGEVVWPALLLTLCSQWL